MTIDRDPSPLAALPPAYTELFGRVVDVCEPDERVHGLWLAGSIARGAADAGSDLDLVLAVGDDDFDEFAAHWRDWLAQITPTLIARTVPGSNVVWCALTDACCRIDGVLEPVSRLPTSFSRVRRVVIDRDGLDALVPTPAARPGPDPARLATLAEEFWRQQAIFAAMAGGRRDLLVCVVGVEQARQLLYDVFVECNQPLPPMGVKQHSSRLTDGQREVLLALPTARPEFGSVVDAMARTCGAMACHGRRAVEAAGAAWPRDLAATVAAFVERELADPATADSRLRR